MSKDPVDPAEPAHNADGLNRMASLDPDRFGDGAGELVSAELVQSGETGENSRISEETGTEPPLLQPGHAFEGPDVERALRAQAAVGWAVTSVFLGVWSVLFSLFTATAAINAGLGMLFALRGWRSNARGWSIVGFLLCAIGFFLVIGRPYIRGD